RFALQKAGLYLGAVQVGGSVLTLAPLTLPYSPEFEPRVDPSEGRRTLAEIATISGGIERTTWEDVFSPRGLRNRQGRDLAWRPRPRRSPLPPAGGGGRRAFFPLVPRSAPRAGFGPPGPPRLRARPGAPAGRAGAGCS